MSVTSSTAYIGLGSNLGNGVATLYQAWRRLGEEEDVHLLNLSRPYFTEPVGMESGNMFTNAAGALRTDRASRLLLESLLAVEADFGRRRDPEGEGYQDRSLDLDILFFGERNVRTAELVIPHPSLAERLFVLVPLMEIAADFRCPKDGVTVREKKKRLLADIRSGRRGSQGDIIRGDWNAP